METYMDLKRPTSLSIIKTCEEAKEMDLIITITDKCVEE